MFLIYNLAWNLPISTLWDLRHRTYSSLLRLLNCSSERKWKGVSFIFFFFTTKFVVIHYIALCLDMFLHISVKMVKVKSCSEHINMTVMTIIHQLLEADHGQSASSRNPTAECTWLNGRQSSSPETSPHQWYKHSSNNCLSIKLTSHAKRKKKRQNIQAYGAALIVWPKPLKHIPRNFPEWSSG